jgi:hypothetical protein
MAEADSSGVDGLDLSHFQGEIDQALKAERAADE